MNQIIVALDVDSRAEALSLVHRLKGRVGLFKIGSQLFTSEGPGLVRKLCTWVIGSFLTSSFMTSPTR
jgi:orotidine-5'-phosphate decarboxylase